MTKDTFFVARNKDNGQFLRLNRKLGKFFDGEIYEAECWYHIDEEEVRMYLDRNGLTERYKLVQMGPLT